jgi:uncharacterized membrane protein
MPLYLSAYLCALVLFTVIDFVWLGFIARSFYVTQLGEMMRPQPALLAAGLFYVVYAFGVVHFAVMPALRGNGWTTALAQGAVLGLVAYATYDLSNMATLKNWPVPMSIVDIAWGTALTATVAAATSVAVGWLVRS